MMQRTVFLSPAALLILIPVFLIGVLSLQSDGVSKHVVLSAAPAIPVMTTLPQLTTDVFRVFDVHSGVVIVSSNETKIVPIASVAKLFTGAAIVASQPLSSITTVTWSDLAAEGEAGKLSYADVYTYQELLFPLLLESSNDAASTLNRSIGSTLLDSMNTRAKTVGATDTVFTDPSGFRDDTVSTAFDIQLLLTSVYTNQPHIFDISMLPQYIGTQSGWMNNNPFASEEGYRGGKHGYTTAAGRTAVAIFDEEINGHTFTVGYIMLGSSNLNKDLTKLRAIVRNSATEN